MEVGQVYQNKEIKHTFMRIEAVNPNGWCKVTFDFKRLTPNTFNYHTAYIEMFYELYPTE